MAKITRPLVIAVRAGTVRPKRSKPLWITELGWDSKPDPDGLSLGTQAQYLERALYKLWRQGASTIIYYLMRDEYPDPDYARSRQAGVYFINGKPKPSRTAFWFPFIAQRSSGTTRIWGMAPTAGQRTAVTIDQRIRGRWVPITRLHSSTDRIFTARINRKAGTKLRARTAAGTSLSWTTN